MSKIQPASIVVTPMLGSTTSPYDVQVNITQRLCYPCCSDTPPVFDPRFSVVGVSQVGDGQYVCTLHCEGVICYTPVGGGCCCTKMQPLSQNFTIPIAATATPTVTLAAGASVNTLAASSCQSASRTFVSETPLTLTVATA
ncbi:MAG: hypothetical protein IJ882_08190 [Paludibacteraceae bacterium]|nr:hypothetical protein [Paludibacteraceae bacterium]